jgi:glycosyltransferase involved in cell wall biosynthesis
MSADGPERPPVSVVLPTRNERSYIRDCVDSLLSQTYPAIDEILVVDGGSTDGTLDLLTRDAPRVRVVANPRVTAAAAMNIGLVEARHDLIVRADAHTIYEPDYVARSVAALQESGADWMGGPMRPVGTTSFGRAVAAVTSSPFGVGPGRFHYAEEASDVETVYLGTFDRAIVAEVGGYDETSIQWAAEDQELAFRLRRAGRRLRVDPTIRSWYFPRQSPSALWRQYQNYGMCKASTLKKHGILPYWRPLAPAAMVAGSVAWSALSLARRRRLVAAVPWLGYGTAASVIAVRLARRPGVDARSAFVALAICHWSYGFGFWRGIGRIVRGRPFDARPDQPR